MSTLRQRRPKHQSALSVSACNGISGSSQIFGQFHFHLDRCFKRHGVQMFVKLWYQSHREISTCSHDAVIRVYDEAGNVIETHEHTGG
jgi:hypothetical protein